MEIEQTRFNEASYLNVTHKAAVVVCVFRAQFGQSRSFNSLSHKNLIINMEPLVPALPSTNEYEETAADAGGMLHTHTHEQTLTTPCSLRPLDSRVGLCGCMKMHNPPTQGVN